MVAAGANIASEEIFAINGYKTEATEQKSSTKARRSKRSIVNFTKLSRYHVRQRSDVHPHTRGELKDPSYERQRSIEHIKTQKG